MRKTKILLNKSNLIHNFNLIQSKSPKSKLIPLVKSNAYGHGQNEIINMLKGLDYFALGIAYTDEAYKIREYDKDSKLLIVVPITEEDIIDVINLDLIPTIESFDVLVKLNEIALNYNKVIDYHLFINTGMNRDGVDVFEFEKIIENRIYLKNVNLSGILSHYASSEEFEFSQKQYSKFMSIINHFNLGDIPLHISNSNGIFNHDNSKMSYIRPGLALYGISSNENDSLDLKPVLELITSVKNIINVKKDEYVGYSFKYKAIDETKVAILPIGYGDGFSTFNYNKAECIINGKKAKIVGSICMDLIMCDVSEIECEIGDDVILIGSDENNKIKVNEIAKNMGVIPYEVTTLLKSKIVREII